ncbi:MAG: AarF/ABC1/UbiB kinase family protein, partial [Planctomycetes bacterium]|nr:AarF/ABC1/UbiB kinase family protein [Planctomycetota bacterium]
MTLNIEQLVAELPDEGPIEDSPQNALQEIIARLSHKPVPVGSVSRFLVLGSLQAKIAAAYLMHWIRSAFADVDEKQAQLNKTHLNAAIKVLGSMGYLRGAIMKVGQALAAYPNLLPDQFIDTLSSLQFEAPPMHYALLREHVRNELGKDPEEIFETFETKAFAAASLGQV